MDDSSTAALGGFVMLYLFSGLIFAIVCAIIAKSKGREPIGWFFIGGLLSLIGLILILALPKNEEEIEKNSLEKGDLRKCPSCAELVKSEAIKCRFCGVDLTPDPTPTRACPYCRKAIHKNDISCKYCLSAVKPIT